MDSPGPQPHRGTAETSRADWRVLPLHPLPGVITSTAEDDTTESET